MQVNNVITTTVISMCNVLGGMSKRIWHLMMIIAIGLIGSTVTVTSASPINDFKDFIDRSGSLQYIQMEYGDNLMTRDNEGNDSIVNKTGVWRIGLYKNVSGGIEFGGYLNNDNDNANNYPGYEGWCQGGVYMSVFASGKRPDGIMIVYDQSGNGIGDLTGGTWTLGLDDVLYLQNVIEMNGIMSDITQIPVATYDGTTLEFPHTVVTPEPTTLGLLGIGGMGVLVRRRRRRRRRRRNRKR